MVFKVAIPQDITDKGKDYLISKGYEVKVGSFDYSEEKMIDFIKGADALLIRTWPYPGKILKHAKNLKVIANHGVGMDKIDLDYCKENNIRVTIAPRSNSNAVAEHVIGLILASAHSIPFMDKQVRNGEWSIRNTHKGRDVIGKTLGIVGFGRIGREVAKKASAGLGIKVIAYDNFVPKEAYVDYVTMIDDIDELYANSDFITYHVPATQETEKMINEDSLKKMKKTAAIINCARGNILNEQALYHALKSQEIAYAALDVLEIEPPEKNNPLFELDNIILTPHNAPLTYETMDNQGIDAAQGIDDVLQGREPEWPVI